MTAHKATQRLTHLDEARRTAHLFLGDAGQLLDLDGYGPLRVDELVPLAHNLSLDGTIANRGAETDGADLQNGVTPGIEARELQVQGHVGSVHGVSDLGGGLLSLPSWRLYLRPPQKASDPTPSRPARRSKPPPLFATEGSLVCLTQVHDPLTMAMVLSDQGTW